MRGIVGKRSRGRPQIRWLEAIEQDLAKLRVRK